jgi:hypothetical protein
MAYDDLYGHAASAVISPYANSGTSDVQAVIVVGVNSTSKYAFYTTGKIKGDTEDTSDERMKSDITPINTLETLKSLSVTKWRYDDAKIKRVTYESSVDAAIKNGNPMPIASDFDDELKIEDYRGKEMRIGPMAKDFNQAFETGNGNTTGINLSDAIGVALRAIQELAEIVDEQKTEIAELRAALSLPEKEKRKKKETKRELNDEEKEILHIAEKRARKAILKRILEAEHAK